MYQQFTAIGKLIIEPDPVQLPGGTEVTKSSIEIKREVRNYKTGEVRDDICIISIEAYGDVGKRIVSEYTRNASIFATGHIQYRKWSGGSTHVFVIHKCEFISRKEK